VVFVRGSEVPHKGGNTVARKSLSDKVMERQERVKSILTGVFRVADPILGELVMQALEELDRMAADVKPSAGMKAVTDSYADKLIAGRKDAEAKLASVTPAKRSQSRKASA
jgi:hypothetical protein